MTNEEKALLVQLIGKYEKTLDPDELGEIKAQAVLNDLVEDIKEQGREVFAGLSVKLNEKQRAAVSWYFDPQNDEGEPWLFGDPVVINVENGELVINGAYLHTDGEWATFPQSKGAEA